MDENDEDMTDRVLGEGLKLAGLETDRQQRLCLATRMELFRNNFGVDPQSCAAACQDIPVEDPCIFHFLLAVFWLKVCLTEGQMCTKFGRDNETMRNQIKFHVDAIASLKSIKIKWIDLNDLPEIFVLSVDGVHFRINEPRTNPSALWCSHKSNSAGQGYEIAILIWHNQVVWAEGPFQPAKHDKTQHEEPDGLQSKIPFGKLVVADRGYRGENVEGDEENEDEEENGQHRTLSIRNHCDSDEPKEFKRRVRARHENFNDRLKTFKILSDRFRHGTDRHQGVFDAVCVLCQHDMENGHPLMDAWKERDDKE